jgi:hypothetical protein
MVGSGGAPPDAAVASGRPGRPGSIIRYNLLRLVLLLLALGLGYLAGLRGLALIVGALLVSGVLSFFLLSRQRTEMAAAIGQVVSAGRVRFTDRVAREDAAADAWHAAREDRPAPPAADRLG